MRNTTRMSIDIPNEEHRKLKAIAALRGVSMKQVILESLSRELYSDNIPNQLTSKVMEETDNDKNINHYNDLAELRKKAGFVMLKISTTTQFEKDLKKATKQGRNVDNIFYIMGRLANEESLERKYRNHRLKGVFVGRWECHIEPDLLLVYFKADKEIIFERIGSHSELFK